MLRTFLKPFAAAGALVVVPVVALAMGATPKGDEEAANARIQPIANVSLAAAQNASGGARSGEDIYKATCGACHETGAANAPKTGDKAAWAPRIKLGLAGLVKSATAGKGAMPPKGGSNASEAELAAAIAYMANKSGANFK